MYTDQTGCKALASLLRWAANHMPLHAYLQPLSSATAYVMQVHCKYAMCTLISFRAACRRCRAFGRATRRLMQSWSRCNRAWPCICRRRVLGTSVNLPTSSLRESASCQMSRGEYHHGTADNSHMSQVMCNGMML